jgi:O-antigen ligase
MGSMSAEHIAVKLRRAGVILLAVLFALVALGFLTAGGWMLLAERQGAALASIIVGGVYLSIALLIFAVRPREISTAGPDRVTVGLALGSSFLQGFTAGQQVRR